MANNLIVCGGTFDHLHKGHESLLKLAFSLGNKVVIGVTSDKYVRSSKLEVGSLKGIESFEKRKQAVLEFIAKEKALNKTEVVEINDLFGPTLSKDLLISTIVVSDDTKKGADIINQKRKELGLGPLEVFIAPIFMSEDGMIMSSARIRKGEINRMGRAYINPLWLKKDLILPENLRLELARPFGEIVENVKRNDDDSYIVTVGDATTKKFNESSIQQNISVVDFKIARKEAFSSFSDLGFLEKEAVVMINNPAGHITHDVFSKVLDIFKSGSDQRIILKIEGEEDLVVLPLVLAAPLNTIIYYGQPDLGLVKILVSEDCKEQAYSLVLKFRPI